ncbi:MAG: methyl-accepting chemotaxis protein [Gammaproteobacteria bacterium]|nr:methyl-accepting chemotaxis protein [Gammaproteobacteria bacterium]
MKQGSSVLRRLFWACMGFGMLMGVVFPFYAQMFVTVHDGMFWLFSVSCWIAGVSIGLVNYSLVKTVLVKRLEKLAEVANAVGNRDLTFQCSLQSNDVLGVIADSVNKMADNLRQDLARIDEAAKQLMAASQDISNDSRNMAAQIEQQQRQTDQVAAAMAQMSATVQEVASHATDAATAARQVDQASDRGKQVISASIGDFDNLSNQVQAAGEVVQRLVADSENVSSVLSVIQSIAEQTNLLALNAAIEAARAGEQGRGFAVVADEVRTLASRTHESTREIQAMVERIQAGTGSAVNAMSAARSKTDESVERVAEVAEALAEITGSIARISEMNTQIANAMNEQKLVTGDVGRSVIMIQQGTTQVVGSAQTSSTNAQQLVGLVTELHELLAQFRLVRDHS